MAHILHIDVSPRAERSVSRSLSNEFIQGWKEAHSGDTITYRDLGHHPVPPVDEPWIAAAYSDPAQHTPELTHAIQLSNELIDEFLAADRYVFGVPMYNFGIPGNLKNYLDQILRVRKTFIVDEGGNYQGLVTGRKALVITARGGTYPKGTPYESYDMQEPYLRLAFGFIGITDVQFVHADNLMSKGEERETSIANAKSTLKELVSGW